MRAFVFICAVLSLTSTLRAAEECSVEVKLLLPPPTIQLVIGSLGFQKQAAGRVYFFDTGDLELLKQGVIVRVRQGANNDITVKVRVPGGEGQIGASPLRQQFPCETNRTRDGEDTDYSVGRKYTVQQVPEMGSDISSVLSPLQRRLLREAGASIDWSRVKRIADVKVTKWEGTALSPFSKLTLEMWDWSTGNILELSAKVKPDAGPSKYAELQRLVDMKGLASSPSQGAKTTIVLETVTNQAPTLR